jgi:hypothetical protein
MFEIGTSVCEVSDGGLLVCAINIQVLDCGLRPCVPQVTPQAHSRSASEYC